MKHRTLAATAAFATAAFATAVFAAYGALAVASAEAATVKVAVIDPVSGPFGAIGENAIRSFRPGLHRLRTWNGQTLDDNIERLTGLGYRIASSGKIAGGSRFVYFDTEIHPCTVIEMGESQPATRALFERIRQASIEWDGQEPVSPLRF